MLANMPLAIDVLIFNFRIFLDGTDNVNVFQSSLDSLRMLTLCRSTPLALTQLHTSMTLE